MKKIVLYILVLLTSLTFLSVAYSEEIKKSNETELNLFTGMFDFSDTGQAAGLFGLQHQNDDLYRKSFLGKISPITGIIMTKLDGTAKGGILLAIGRKFKLPIVALGMGEKEDDLQKFNSE